MMQVDVLSGPLGRGLRGSTCRKQEIRDEMWSLTCSLALYPYRYIYLLTWCHTNRPMITKPTYNNTAPHHRRGYGCPPPFSPLRPPPLLPLRSCCDLSPVTLAGAEKQRSDSGTRALCVRDDEEGHLICRSGDVLQERCTHCHYYYSTPIS